MIPVNQDNCGNIAISIAFEIIKERIENA